jgi:predicted amidophosphoribosyltransferase
MNSFLICENAQCRFLLDRRLNGRSLDGVRKIVKNCPDCGADWSSTCPTCGQALAVRMTGGLPHAVCCEQRTQSGSRAA